MKREAVREYVEHTQSIIESSPQMDEANTKAAVLREFIDLLDWEIPTDTQLEYSVEAFGRTYKVDYALILEGTPVAFLEAKGADTPLTTKHEEQLSSYMTNKNVNYGILTNGKAYRFYQRRVTASNVNVQKVGDVDLEELPKRLAVLRAFNKEAIGSGESSKILGRINELREARQILEAEKDGLASEIVELLASTVSDAISSPAEPQAKEMIDRLIQDIESEIDSDGPVSSKIQDESSNKSHIPEITADASGEYVIKILSEGNTIAAFGNDNQSDVMAEAVSYLVEHQNLISKIEPMPYIPGREKAIINDQPSSPHDEQAMRFYRELSGGYYLDTHMDKVTKKRTLERLVDELGLEVEFGIGW
ncbi:type I restriction enzyme HsdR N-terminal domain-containing protein [Haloferax sp. YSSS75]|uniref:type I restriction enzyme HsdR N-terminal domain-containing protein n=1 Tax=Haloferax sp. YSSS75 TaxID=3388564 RepID=UPI00398CCA93